MKKFILFFSSAIFWMAGCSTDTISIPSIAKEGNEEFKFNYNILHYYYYKAEEELRTPEYYLNNPDTILVNPKYADVAEVVAMYLGMSDLFTFYYPSQYFDAIQSSITESKTNDKSFGMEVDSSLQVKYVYRVGPAATAGVHRGDQIIALDSIPLNDDSTNAFDKYNSILEQKTEDNFLLTVLQNGEARDFSLTRESLLTPTVYLDSIDSVPVIRITEFSNITNGFGEDGSYAEFQDVLNQTDGAKSTVLDLRGNPGGSISLCTQMAGELLSKGDTIIVEKNWKRESPEKTFSTLYTVNEKDGIAKGRYVVLMLDSNSASCAEMFAAALTANIKAPIVGTNSFGKGIGQYYIQTPENGFGVITAIQILDKNGESFHSYGFVPDFDIPDSVSALVKAVELAKAATFKRQAGYNPEVQTYWTSSKYKAIPRTPEESLKLLLRGMALKKLDYLDALKSPKIGDI